MAIKIRDQDDDIFLTEDEYVKFKSEYDKAFTHYAGTPPSFEGWLRSTGKGQRFLAEQVNIPNFFR